MAANEVYVPRHDQIHSLSSVTSAAAVTRVTDVEHPSVQVGCTDLTSFGDATCFALSFVPWRLPAFWQQRCPSPPIHTRQRCLIMLKLRRHLQRRPPRPGWG
jgi:hypothetical protein